jgi:hypothetical protein
MRVQLVKRNIKIGEEMIEFTEIITSMKNNKYSRKGTIKSNPFVMKHHNISQPRRNNY